MSRASFLLCALSIIPGWGWTQIQSVDLPRDVDDPALPAAMHGLAENVLAKYQDTDRERYLRGLFALQMVAGRYAEADATMTARRELSSEAAARLGAAPVAFDIYAKARVLESAAGFTFDEAYRRAFRLVFAQLADTPAYDVAWVLGTSPSVSRDDLHARLAQPRQGAPLPTAEALDLVRSYLAFDVFRSITTLIGPLVDEDRERRYHIDDEILVKTPHGATLSLILVRPKAVEPLPALLEFTIYTYPGMRNEAVQSAAHGYVGVVAFSRGKRGSPDDIVPYEHDGEDARAVIDWIAHQPWCDGRVGMFGGSYNGFAIWSTLKRPPPALKAVMASVSGAPGIGEPMQGNIFANYFYPWPQYVTNNRFLDEDWYNDTARWALLDRTWYQTGESYRSLERLDGALNTIFRGWLDHPSYDSYWQKLIPYGEEFAHIGIPVLQTTGYYDGGQIGTLYYLREHVGHDLRADHTLVVGPYGHLGAQHRSDDVVQGYPIDPAARMDFHELRYQWFDHVLKGAAKPALLADRVNFEVMGANEWRHASSLEAMGNGSLRLYLAAGTAGNDSHVLAASAPTTDAVAHQRVDFADRHDVDWVPSSLVLGPPLDARDGLVFTSEPLAAAMEIDGVPSGELQFVANKRDVDLALTFYEVQPDGRYFRLTQPYMFRASYLQDRSHRQLLTPGVRQQLSWRCECVTGRQLQAGSRIALALRVNKQRNLQINYGTGGDVSDESIADANEPLELTWLAGSFLDVPIRRQQANPQ
jgi:putative CocE/NonD family hydrolase